jgi:hypothetical protein
MDQGSASFPATMHSEQAERALLPRDALQSMREVLLSSWYD